MSRPLRREEVAELAATLDAIRHRIDAGELSATPAFRHRLDGASVALAVVLGRRSTLVDELVLDS